MRGTPVGQRVGESAAGGFGVEGLRAPTPKHWLRERGGRAVCQR